MIEEREPKQKLPIKWIIIVTTFSVFVLFVHLYNEGDRGLDCETKFKEWETSVIKEGSFTFKTMEQFDELLNSGLCNGIVDRQKTLDINPELKSAYENWKKANHE